MLVSLPKKRNGRALFTLACAFAVVGVSGFFWACTTTSPSTSVTGGSAALGQQPPPPEEPAAPGPLVAKEELESHFKETITPFLNTYCISCHSGAEATAGLDLAAYPNEESIAKNPEMLNLFIAKLKNGDMPPMNANKHPPAAESKNALAWFQNVRRLEASRNAGDPGIVLAHRLSNAEYDYSIRDLTGVDIRPAKEFPVDSANQAGFDNTGESLTMEPELFKKYMEAARFVSEHMVLKTGGIDFAPHPMVSVTDRDKYFVNKIVDFYLSQPTELRDYFLAAWRYENRASLGRQQATLYDFGNELGVSRKYLTKVWDTLNDKNEKVGPVAAVQALWRAMPKPDGKTPDAASAAAANLGSFVTNLRQKTRPSFANLSVRGVDNGNQMFVLWKDRQYESTRFTYVAGSAMNLTPADLGEGTPAAPLMALPQDEAATQAYEAAFQRFSSVFPDVFYVKERARIYLNPNGERNLTGRLLSAGLHSQTGYFRDDAPLYQLILDDQQKHEIDTLWKDFELVTDWNLRMYQSMIWFERSDSSLFKTREFDFVRTEERDIIQEPIFSQTREILVKKIAGMTTNPTVVEAFEEYYDIQGKIFRTLDKRREEVVPVHLEALQQFAEKAYRRPLTAAEKESIVSFYHALRKEEQLDHEEAMRDSLVSVLMSPHFTYRFMSAPVAEGAQPLTGYELASRLSYFLWSSVPDEQLLTHARAGDLSNPEVLKAQVRRMANDPRIAGMVTEFAGNWLDFRRFEDHNGVDRSRFTTFDNNLREAMFQEPIRFMTHVVQKDESVLDLIYGNYTFVNPSLAKHYGMPEVKGDEDTWVRVDNALTYQRGGLLPMGVFLTKNAPGLRTSPVKRGYWVVKRVLGQEIPAPPPNVPVLPADEAQLGNLTLPQALAKHREDPSCATCHIQFDAMGLSFEGYGPVGEFRTVDLGGKPVQNLAEFRNGAKGVGLTGLQNYIRVYRQNDFLDSLARKLLANALGRSLILSDDLLVEQMVANLKANNYRFSSLLETIVTSPQFLNKRGQNSLARKDG